MANIFQRQKHANGNFNVYIPTARRPIPICLVKTAANVRLSAGDCTEHFEKQRAFCVVRINSLSPVA